ncbi:MAG: hypothetical protein IT270_06910 [Saprospiraceae bacterium]|nr:hypothetical protein [Saprospiraceae bacterium]
MFDDKYILKNPALGPSQDYQQLRQSGIEHITNLARQMWTDFNVHDPGITILELLCYAITDLGYRTNFGIRNLLTEDEKGASVIHANFHTAREIFHCNPVSFSDFRKILVDIPGVRNAWIAKHLSVRYCLDTGFKKLIPSCNPNNPTHTLLPPLNGLFDVLLEYEDFVEKNRMVQLGEPADGLAVSINPKNKGLLFTVHYPMILRKVHVSGNEPGSFDVALMRLNDAGVFEKTATSKQKIQTANTKTALHLHFELEAGTIYLLFVEQTASATFQLHLKDPGVFPYQLDHFLEIRSGYLLASNTTNSKYYFFFEWELEYAVSESAQEMQWLGLPDNTVPGAPIGTNANNQGLAFNVLRNTTLHTVDVYPDTAGELTVCLFAADGEVLQVKKFDVDVSELNQAKRLQLHWWITPGNNYRLTGHGIKMFQATPNPGFPFVLTDVLEINAGLTSTGNTTTTTYYFFFNWKVGFSSPFVKGNALTRLDVQQSVVERLQMTRNLCQDTVEIRDLEVEQIGICADLEVRPDTDIEELLANIMYQMEVHIAPPVNFYTIQELLDKGKTTDQIFEGPVLEHGFIDHDEFAKIDRRTCFRTSDIIQIIMDFPEVLAVKEIVLMAFTEVTASNPVVPGDNIVTFDGIQYKARQEPWLLSLTDPTRYAPDFNTDRTKIIFYKNGLPYYANKAKVQLLFEDIRARQFRHKLKGHEKDMPVEPGVFMDTDNYTPIQVDLPKTYQVGIYRVPSGYPALRKAQSRQLKAYLMFFEQIFANYLAQLNNLKDLFGWEVSAPPTRSYFTQRVEGSIADIEDLFFDYPNLASALNNIIESKETAEDRKNRFLEHLMGRFAESFTDYALLMRNVMGKKAPERLIRDRQELLTDYPAVSSGRGKAFDYRYPADPANISGYQRRVYRLLGIWDVSRRNFAGNRFRVQPVLGGGWQFVLKDALLIGNVLESKVCDSEEQICTLLDSMLAYGSDKNHWEKNGGIWQLVHRCGSTTDVIGNLQSGDDALWEQTILYFEKHANAEGFHIVEHILLRKRTQEDPFMPVELPDEDDCECPQVQDPYSFRASIILPSWAGRFRSTRFRQYVEKLLRLEVPAHVYLKICWINHCEMKRFEAIHDEWMMQHAGLKPRYRGKMPLKTTGSLLQPEKNQMASYTVALKDLIEKLHHLTTVFPLARLHDCETVDADEPQITLNNTNLGTL